MGNYATLKAAVNTYIKQNGNQEITGQVLNNILNTMITSLGNNYQFAGVATPTTNPGTPDQNVVYFASQAGTYTNFGSPAPVLALGIHLLSWNGTVWSVTTWFTVDDVPTAGSDNLVKSGGVLTSLEYKTKCDYELYQGVILRNWNYRNSDADRITTKTIFVSTNKYKIVWNKDKYNILIVKYDGSSTIESGWLNTGEAVIEGLQKIAINIRFTNNSSITPADAGDLNLYIFGENSIAELLQRGYLYAGQADVSTIPTSATGQKLFYVATSAGTYTHFLNNETPLTIASDGLYFLAGGIIANTWQVEQVLQIDSIPTNNSNNLVKSGGVYNALNIIAELLQRGYLYAGQANESTTPTPATGQRLFYVATTAGTYTHFLSNGDTPIVIAKAGLYFLTGGVEVDDWNCETVLEFDDVPTAGSKNLVESGSVYLLTDDKTLYTCSLYQGVTIKSNWGYRSTDTDRITTKAILVSTKKIKIQWNSSKYQVIIIKDDGSTSTETSWLSSGEETIEGLVRIALNIRLTTSADFTPSDASDLNLLIFAEDSVVGLLNNYEESNDIRVANLENVVDYSKTQYLGVSTFLQGYTNRNGTVASDSTRITTGLIYPQGDIKVTIPSGMKCSMVYGSSNPMTDAGWIISNGGSYIVPFDSSHKLVGLNFGYTNNSNITPSDATGIEVIVNSLLYKKVDKSEQDISTLNSEVESLEPLNATAISSTSWRDVMNNWNEDTKLKDMYLLTIQSTMIPNKQSALGYWKIENNKAVVATSDNTEYIELTTFPGDYNVVYLCNYATNIYHVIYTDDDYNVIAKGYLGVAPTSQKIYISLVSPIGATKLLVSSRQQPINWYKLDERYAINDRVLNAPAINDGLHEKSPSSQVTVFDDITGICCSYYVATSGWGEGNGVNKLSIFPINQPSNVFFKTVPTELFNLFDTNVIACGSNVFRMIGNNVGDAFQYLDYNFDTDTFGTVQTCLFNGSTLTRTAIFDYIESQGFTVDRTNTKVVISCRPNGKVNASEKYITIIASRDYAVACYTPDNCGNIYPIAVIPEHSESEATFVPCGNKLYALIRQDPALAGEEYTHGCIKLLTADYDTTDHTCSNWTTGVAIDYSTNSRPDIAVYKGKVLILVENQKERPYGTNGSASMGRNGFRLIYGTGTDPNLYNTILDVYAKWSTTEQTLLINADTDVYVVYEAARNWGYKNSGGTYGTGRGELIFAKVGEYVEKENILLSNE